MASISHDPGGKKRILFCGADGERRAVRLGKVSERVAKSVCGYVESLVASAKAKNTWEPETAAWVGKLDSVLYDKLAAVYLVPKREPMPQADAMTLGAFLDQYIDSRTDIKLRTRWAFQQVQYWLTEHFGEGRDIRSISPGMRTAGDCGS